MKLSIFIILIFSWFFYGFSQDSWTKLLKAEVFHTSKGDLPYRIYIPKEIKEGQSLAFVFFLHGAGERGNDNKTQLLHGVKYFMEDNIRNDYYFILIAPQCPESARWVEVDWSKPSHKMPARISVPLKQSFQLIDSLILVHNVDTNRIYITGLSMGGFGVWDALERKPKFFAAAMPICGGGDESKAGLLIDIPIKAFHGNLDHLVIPERTTNMVNAIRLNGGIAEATIFNNYGHLCWNKVYSDSINIKWLFSNKRNK